MSLRFHHRGQIELALLLFQLDAVDILGQLVSGYLDFAERQAEREQPMTMQDWANHLDRILTMSGEQLLVGNGSVTHIVFSVPYSHGT